MPGDLTTPPPGLGLSSPVVSCVGGLSMLRSRQPRTETGRLTITPLVWKLMSSMHDIQCGETVGMTDPPIYVRSSELTEPTWM